MWPDVAAGARHVVPRCPRLPPWARTNPRPGPAPSLRTSTDDRRTRPAPAPVPPPAHPLAALTTSELARYRCQLETALATPAPAQAGLRDRLSAVLGEQADRATAAAGEARHG